VLLRRGEGCDRLRVAELLRDCIVDGAPLGVTRIVDGARELAAQHGIELTLGTAG